MSLAVPYPEVSDIQCECQGLPMTPATSGQFGAEPLSGDLVLLLLLQAPLAVHGPRNAICAR